VIRPTKPPWRSSGVWANQYGKRPVVSSRETASLNPFKSICSGGLCTLNGPSPACYGSSLSYQFFLRNQVPSRPSASVTAVAP
jgi:hypothetical protein